jgi:hypothetical protein
MKHLRIDSAGSYDALSSLSLQYEFSLFPPCFDKDREMFLNRRVFTALAMCVALSATSAFAGGHGGSKQDSTVTITNNTDWEVGVAVNPNQQLLNAQNPQEFVARGGRILNPGQSHTFRVRAGNARILAVDEYGVLGDINVDVARGQDVRIGVHGENDLRL